MSINLDGTSVLVTGGSSGIGAASARRFAETGASVALIARRKNALNSLADDIGALALVADVTDGPAVSRAVSEVVHEFGKIDVVVVACHEHGTALSGFLPSPWDHLGCQSWDHPARLADGSSVCSLTHHVVSSDVEVISGGIQGGQCG